MLRDNEDGIYVLACAMWLLGFLAVVALVVDSASLYRHRQFAQRAADLGAIAGLGYRASKGWAYFHDGNLEDVGRSGNRDGEVEERTRETVLANLAVHGAIVEQDRVNADYSSLHDRISVSLEYEVPLFFVSYLPGVSGCGAGHTCTVRVAAAAEMQPANIGLILDTSGSMNCPADAGPDRSCSCLTQDGCARVPREERRLAHLKDAVTSFMSFFNPNRDHVSIVPFNIVSQVAFSVKDSGENAQPFGLSQSGESPHDTRRVRQFYRTIEELDARGNTNICDGIWRTYEDMSSVSPAILRQAPSFFVLFTDGAPTAGRFRFTEPTAYMESMVRNLGEEGGDWWMGSVQWSEGLSTGGIRRYAGPSQLVQIDDIPYGHSEGEPPNESRTCGDLAPYHDDFPRSVNPCLNSFRFNAYEPSEKRRYVSGDDAEGDFNDVGDFTHSLIFMQQFYFCAIELSDMLREEAKGLVYTIGLGAGAFEESVDPFQNLSDDFNRKEFFLRRLAFDRYHGQRDPAFGPRRQIALNGFAEANSSPQMTVGYNSYRTYEMLSRDPHFHDYEGAYEGIEDPRKLREKFVRVAKDILIRLVQ